MHVLRNLTEIPASCQGSVLALGNFDGVHLGHQAVLAETVAIAKRLNAPAAALTFEPHPREFFNPIVAPLNIISSASKAALLENAGLQALFVLRFDAALAERSAESFVRDILVAALNVRHVVTGENFTFGKGRGGTALLLEAWGKTHGFGYTRVAPVGGEEACSSTRIRALLKAGDVHGASALLGRPYAVTGPVLHGDKRGRTLGFPTANIAVAHLFPPAFGVYAIRTTLQDGRRIPGVANLGIRPTVEGKTPLLEAHLFDFNEDLYGQTLHVELTAFLRPERKFDTLDALKKQILEDSAIARKAAHGI